MWRNYLTVAVRRLARNPAYPAITVGALVQGGDPRSLATFGINALLTLGMAVINFVNLSTTRATQRAREVGLRKVLGARTRDIVRLLVWQFSRPVLVANLLAWPIAWWLMRGWLNGFDDRVALTPAPFVAAGAAALAIAVVTVGGHAWRVARTSPVKALRYE